MHHEVCNTGITNMKNGNLRANKTELGQKHRGAKRPVTVHTKIQYVVPCILHFFFKILWLFFIFLYLVLKIIVLKFSVSLRRIHYVFVACWSYFTGTTSSTCNVKVNGVQVVYKQTETRGFEGRPNAVSSALFVVLVQPMR